MDTTKTDEATLRVPRSHPTIKLLFSDGFAHQTVSLGPKPLSIGRDIGDEEGIEIPQDKRASRRHASIGWETIPPFGMRIIETTGGASTTSHGWAELASDGAVSGFAVLRQTKSVGAKLPPAAGVLPLLNSFRDRFMIPFDQLAEGNINAVAISNAEDEPVTIQITVRNESGAEISKEKPITLGPRGYTAFA